MIKVWDYSFSSEYSLNEVFASWLGIIRGDTLGGGLKGSVASILFLVLIILWLPNEPLVQLIKRCGWSSSFETCNLALSYAVLITTGFVIGAIIGLIIDKTK